MKALALIDIDGVVADDSHRIQHALDKNWDDYFHPDNVSQDGVWSEGVELAQGLRLLGFDVEYLTGRWSVLRGVTERWMDNNEVPVARLSMREPRWYHTGLLTDTTEWESLPLAEFKVRHIQQRLDNSSYDKVVLYDDDPAVIAAVQEAFGEDAGVLCEWSKKPEEMVKLAQA